MNNLGILVKMLILILCGQSLTFLQVLRWHWCCWFTDLLWVERAMQYLVFTYLSRLICIFLLCLSGLHSHGVPWLHPSEKTFVHVPSSLKIYTQSSFSVRFYSFFQPQLTAAEFFKASSDLLIWRCLLFSCQVAVRLFCDPTDSVFGQAPPSDFPGKNIGVGLSFPFSRGSSNLRSTTSHIVGGLLRL